MELQEIHPPWLTAMGTADRLEVLRSPELRDTDDLYQPVDQFIRENGLVLAARQEFDDGDWMAGRVEVSVYVPPAVRNGVLAGTDLSLPWFSGLPAPDEGDG